MNCKIINKLQFYLIIFIYFCYLIKYFSYPIFNYPLTCKDKNKLFCDFQIFSLYPESPD